MPEKPVEISPLSALLPQPLIDIRHKLYALIDERDDRSLSEKVSTHLSQRIVALLMDIGGPVEEIKRRISDLVISLTEDDDTIDSFDTAIQQMYETYARSRDRRGVTIIVPKTLRDDSDVRIALRTIRESAGYDSLFTERVWTLPGTALKQRLESEPCSADGCHWYMMLARIMRLRYPQSMVGTGMISASDLRNFLCDFVFCVPREMPVRQTRSRSNNGGFPRKYTKKPKTPGNTSLPKSTSTLPQNSSTSGGNPSPERRANLAPKQREYSDLFYGWDGTSYNPDNGLSIPQIAQRTGQKYMTVFMGLKAAKSKLLLTVSPEIVPAETELGTRREGDSPIVQAIKNNGSSPEKEEEVHIPAFLRNRRPRSITPLPKRTAPIPTYDISEPRVSQPTERPKFQTVVIEKSKPLPTVEEMPEVREPISPTVTFPETLGYEAGLEWLRNEPSVQAGLEAAQNIPSFKRDDLSITALFRREYPVLHTAFTRLRTLSKHSCLEIIHDIYHPDPLLILKKEPEVLQKVKVCFAHHERGEHESFTQALKEISHDADIAGKIMEICERYNANSFIEGLSLIVDFPWTSEDDKKYETVSLRQALQHTRGFSTLMEAVDRFPSDVSLKDLQKKLNGLNVVVIPGATSWPRYKSSQATSMTLLALLESLIKQETDYKKDDEKSTKKLRRKLTEIAGG